MSNSATWTQASPTTFASKAAAQKPVQTTPRDASKQAAPAQRSWKETFAFPAYSGLLEIV